MITLFSNALSNAKYDPIDAKPGVKAHTQFNSKSIACAMLVSSCLALSACGGGGPGSSAAPATPTSLAAKTKTMIGFDLQVTPVKANSAAGTLPSSFEVSVSDTAAVATLVAFVGKDYETAKPATSTQKSPGVWTVTVPADVSADSGLLLKMTLKDNDIFETGLTDFPLM